MIDGRKWFITNAAHPNCKLLIVMGKTNPDADVYNQQSMVLVPMDTPGVTVVRNIHVMNHHAPEGHCEITFANVRVPVSNLLGEEGMGFVYLMQELAWERLQVAISAVSNMEAALEWTLDYTRERQAFGKAIIDFQNSRFTLAEVKTQVTVARTFVEAASTIFGLDVPHWVPGLLITIFVGLVLLGGIQRIAAVAETLVPSMIVLYVTTALIYILLNITHLPAVFGLIISRAFSPSAAVGGS